MRKEVTAHTLVIISKSHPTTNREKLTESLKLSKKETEPDNNQVENFVNIYKALALIFTFLLIYYK